jgi:hypothetical protein
VPTRYFKGLRFQAVAPFSFLLPLGYHLQEMRGNTKLRSNE